MITIIANFRIHIIRNTPHYNLVYCHHVDGKQLNP